MAPAVPIVECLGSQPIILADPADHGVVVTTDLCGPLGRIRLMSANHVQGQKSFSRPGMFCLDRQPSEFRQRLVPFCRVWSYHLCLHSVDNRLLGALYHDSTF